LVIAVDSISFQLPIAQLPISDRVRRRCVRTAHVERVVPVDEELDNAGVAALGRLDQAVGVVLEREERVGAVLQQQLGHGQVAVVAGERQGAVLAVAARAVHVQGGRVVGEQALRRAVLAGTCRLHQRREASLGVRLVRQGARRQQRLHHVRVPVLAAQRQGRLARTRYASGSGSSCCCFGPVTAVVVVATYT